jgi:predicted ATPase
VSFRVKRFLVNSENLSCPSVCLSGDGDNANYFTVIIGNNGTGKSRFVSNLVSAFVDISRGRRRRAFEYHLEYDLNGKRHEIKKVNGKRLLSNNLSDEETFELPQKLIAIATSLSDKFPLDMYDRSRNFEKPFNQKDEFYSYLGTRNRFGGSSAKSLMDRAIGTMLQNIHEDDHNERYREIFSYLDYEPIIKISYLVNRPEYMRDSIVENHFNGEALKSLLKAWSTRRRGYRSDIYERSASNYSVSHWDDLARLYIDILMQSKFEKRKSEYSFLINFSEQNSIRSETSSDLNNSNRYFLLEELRRFDLVKGPQISLYKKNGGEFGFNDASSGEASILSTLIGMIPNLENDSLIVIDEPEVSLHPTWQYRYIELIDKIISKFSGCHVIIATHSHFLLSDLPLNRSQVVHFKNNKKSIVEVNYIDHETHGLSAEDILLNVFDMPSTRNYFLSKEVSEALELLASGDKNTDRYVELILKFKEYLPNLKRVDPLYEILNILLASGK